MLIHNEEIFVFICFDCDFFAPTMKAFDKRSWPKIKENGLKKIQRNKNAAAF